MMIARKSKPIYKSYHIICKNSTVLNVFNKPTFEKGLLFNHTYLN